MATIDEIRQQLDSTLADIDEREQAADKRDHAIAQAAELLSESAAVQAAYCQGSANMRDRVLVLIDRQLDQLKRDGIHIARWTALHRTVTEMVLW